MLVSKFWISTLTPVVQPHLPIGVIAEEITDFPIAAHIIVSCLKKNQKLVNK